MGAAERRVGLETEQMVARYLRGRGMAGVERSVRTGYRTADRSLADAGDLTGLPGISVQVKSLRPATRAETKTRAWLAETEQQRAASGCSVGLLIVRRWGTTDAGRWWAFMYARDLFGLADGFSHQVLPLLAAAPTAALAPVRLELSDLVDMMQLWGWMPVPQTEGTG
jgi:hypothetical protein